MRSAAEPPGNDHLRLLVDAVTDYAVFLLDTGGHVRSWNPGARRLKGYTEEEIVGRHFSTFYTPEDRERDHPAHELEIAQREGRYEEEGWRVRKDGSRFWANVVITALRDKSGELVGYGKVTRDLTARRLAEEQLRANAADLTAVNRELEQFRLLVSNVRDYAIFMLDPGGVTMTWNEGARALKGYEEAEVIGRHFSMFYTREDQAREYPAYELEVAGRVGRYEDEGWRVRKDGSHFWAGVVITAIRNDSGVLLGYAKVTRDLTERREAEQRLRATNVELERFAVAVAHDLTEPLHTIVGLADLTARRLADRLDDESREYLDHIRDGARRLRRLLDALLEYSRTSQREMRHEPVSSAEAVGHVVRALGARIADAQATIDYDGGALPVVEADPAMLELVLQNLISNALKFRGDDPPHVAITAQREDEMWRLAVIDNGIGIASGHRETIFDLFQRLQPADAYPGTGTGLALVKRIVERHGGRLGVESSVGEGSRFWFTMPAPSSA